MICSTLLANLGYECRSVADNLTYIQTPFTLEDGSGVGVYIDQVAEDKFIITDDGHTLFEMSSRGIAISKQRVHAIQDRLARQGIVLNGQGEITATASAQNLMAQMQQTIQATIIADTMGYEWYKIPRNKFELTVKSTFKRQAFSQTVSFDNKIIGMSGHQITIPISLTGQDLPNKQIFTATAPEKGSWASAYGVLGKITDLQSPSYKATNDQLYVIIDDEAAGNQLNTLLLLFNHASAKILPYHKKEIWLPQLKAA